MGVLISMVEYTIDAAKVNIETTLLHGSAGLSVLGWVA
jgi:hypothetical protein